MGLLALVAAAVLLCTASRALAVDQATHSLFCNVIGACSPCGDEELKHEHCVKTGYKEQLQCTTKQVAGEQYQVVLSKQGTGTTSAALIDFSRGCTPHAHKARAEGGSTASLKERARSAHLSVFHMELIMLVVLCVALPVVFWRKMKQRAI